MSDDKRRARVVRAARPKAPPTATYWLTRDLVGGQLSPRATVWLARPRLVVAKPRDLVYWTCDVETVGLRFGEETKDTPVILGSWLPQHCPAWPDDERMSVRVGEERDVAPVIKLAEIVGG